MQWLPQTLLLGGATFLMLCVLMPPPMMSGIGALWAALVLPEVLPARQGGRLRGCQLLMVWVCSVAVAVSAVAWDVFNGYQASGATLKVFRWLLYLAAPAWLIASALWLCQRRIADAAEKERWKIPVMAWLLSGALMWIGGGYFQNQRTDFYGGLAATLVVLVLWRVWFRLGAVAAQSVNTLILLGVGLSVADPLFHQLERPPLRADTCRYYYSYTAAKGDPAAFGRFANYLFQQHLILRRDTFMPAPNTPLPFRLRPNSRTQMANSVITINRHGFRGPDFPLDKGNAYRIIALGESTTFGITLQAADKPWPELLEQMIRERLKTRRPVEVINAGSPLYSIENNLDRMRLDILALKPDLVISYHGLNGFNLIDESVLPTAGPPPPPFRERPLWLAARLEHRLAMMIYWRRVSRSLATGPRPLGDPLKTRCAAAYRGLIECARTNGIRLALANFSLAANLRSPQSVIDFYRGGSGLGVVDAEIRANEAHSRIVAELAAEHPEVCLVDTHPHLDGEYEKFIDLAHLTQEGQCQMAENVFTGIQNILRQDVGDLSKSGKYPSSVAASRQ